MVIVKENIEEVYQNETIIIKIYLNIFFLLWLGIDRRGVNGHINGNRNDYNNSRPSRFSAKRSRSPSPVRSTYSNSSRFDNRETNGTHNNYNNNNRGNEYKRPRTDNSHPSHVCLF